MTKTEKEILEQMKDELHREFVGGKQWVLAVAKREMSETEKEQHPNYDTMLSLLLKTTSSSLIDGTTLPFLRTSQNFTGKEQLLMATKQA